MRICKHHGKNRFFILGLLSLAACISGFIWNRSDPDNDYAFHLFFFAWIAFLLVVGYTSTPSNSIFGKVAFGFVVIMVTGIAMKMLNLFGANIMIIVGLLGLFATYSKCGLD